MDLNHQEVRNVLHNEIALVHMYWRMWVAFFMGGDERLRILEASGGPFFAVVREALLDGFFLGVCRLTDPPKTINHPNLTLERLLDYPAIAADQAILSSLKQKIEAAKAACQPFRTYRNKRLAHIDLHTVVSGASESIAPEVAESALAALADVLNTHDCYLYNGQQTVDFAVLLPGHVETVLERLEQGCKWRMAKALALPLPDFDTPAY